jgi:superoxide dismutase, Cu-Zn family
MRYTALACALCLALVGSAIYGQMSMRGAKADLYNTRGEKIGTATLSQTASGVRVALDVSKVAPGLHGIHIHTVGKCDPPDFSTAGAHFNPAAKKHGLKNPQGPHAGDAENLIAGADGTAHAEFVESLVTLAEDAPNSLFHPNGTALVIHANPDDQMTDPSGNSGARVACGVISK